MTGPVRLRFLGTSGFAVTTEADRQVLFAPLIDGTDAIPPSPVGIDELAGAAAILVSHAAYDHLGQALEICAAGEAILVCGPEVRMKALASGLSEDRIAKVFPGARIEIAGISVKTLAAVHLSMLPTGDGYVSGVPLSFVLETDGGTRIYHSGDTALFGDLRLYGELYQPDVALLCVGATEPMLTPMEPAEAAIAADWLNAPVAVPMHYIPGDDSPVRFTDALADRRRDIEARTLAEGEETVITADRPRT
jgi:L-ascorbate metabolism protein UlaG (beta-lactamase superfamily)